MRRYRIDVLEEAAGRNQPVKYHARPDLSGACEGDVPSRAKKTALAGIADDPRFRGLQVISCGFKSKNVLHVIVRSAHLVHTSEIPGRVYRAPQ